MKVIQKFLKDLIHLTLIYDKCLITKNRKNVFPNGTSFNSNCKLLFDFKTTIITNISYNKENACRSPNPIANNHCSRSLLYHPQHIVTVIMPLGMSNFKFDICNDLHIGSSSLTKTPR